MYHRNNKQTRAYIRGNALYLTNPVNEKYTISMVNVQGKTIYKKNVHISEKSRQAGLLPVNHLANGLYIAKITSNGLSIENTITVSK